MFQGRRVMCIKTVLAGLLISVALGSFRIDASLAVCSPRGQKCSISDSLQILFSAVSVCSLYPVVAIHVVDSNC